MKTDDAPTSMTSLEAEAVLMVRSGMSMADAAKCSHLSVERIEALIERANAHRGARPLPPTVARTPTRSAPPAPRPVPHAPTPPRITVPTTPHPGAAPAAAADRRRVEPDELDTDELLEWADKVGYTRASTLTSRIRTAVEELRELRRREHVVAEKRTRVTVLERQLRQARQELREAAGTKKTTAVPIDEASGSSGHAKAERTRIREWAAANGRQVAERGSIPETIQAAYRAVHPEETGA